MPTLTNGVFAPQPDGDFQISETGVAELYATAATADAAIGSLRATVQSLESLIDGIEGLTYVGVWSPSESYRANDVVVHGGDSWARLVAGSDGEPGTAPNRWGLVARRGDGGGFGELSETDVDGLWEGVETTVLPSQVQGLADALTALSAVSYDSGWRDITSSIPVEVASGRLLARRTGWQVWLEFDALRTTETPDMSYHSWAAGTLPTGFRPPRFQYAPLAPQVGNNALNYVTNTTHALGPVRLAANGGLVVYMVKHGSNNSLLPVQGLVTFATSQNVPATPPGAPA